MVAGQSFVLSLSGAIGGFVVSAQVVNSETPFLGFLSDPMPAGGEDPEILLRVEVDYLRVGDDIDIQLGASLPYGRFRVEALSDPVIDGDQWARLIVLSREWVYPAWVIPLFNAQGRSAVLQKTDGQHDIEIVIREATEARNYTARRVSTAWVRQQGLSITPGRGDALTIDGVQYRIPRVEAIKQSGIYRLTLHKG